MLCLAEIVSRFDVVAFQEIKRDLGGLRLLVQALGTNLVIMELLSSWVTPGAMVDRRKRPSTRRPRRPFSLPAPPIPRPLIDPPHPR